MITSLLHAIGESDCEHLASGFLAQPVNAISGLAYAVFGIVVFVSIRHSLGADRIIRAVFGSLLVATGLGNVLFHGTQGSASRFLHDASFLLMLFFIAIATVWSLRGWSLRSHLAFFAGVVLALSVLLVVWPSATNMLAGISAVALIGSDVLARRAQAIRRRWWRGAVLAMGVALAFYVAGRTGGPLCDSSSLLQGHALWHVLSGAAFWAYFEATAPSRTGERVGR